MSTLRQINPGQPATEFRPVQRLVDHVVSPRRFFVLLVGIFALLGLILASLGIYGVISYSVTQRTQEIGIRMALGASQARVQLAVIGKTLLLALIGIATGTVASLAIADLIASLLLNAGHRSGYVPEHDFVAADGGAPRRIYTGPKGFAHQPNGCVAQPLKRREDKHRRGPSTPRHKRSVT